MNSLNFKKNISIIMFSLMLIFVSGFLSACNESPNDNGNIKNNPKSGNSKNAESKSATKQYQTDSVELLVNEENLQDMDKREVYFKSIGSNVKDSERLPKQIDVPQNLNIAFNLSNYVYYNGHIINSINGLAEDDIMFLNNGDLLYDTFSAYSGSYYYKGEIIGEHGDVCILDGNVVYKKNKSADSFNSTIYYNEKELGEGYLSIDSDDGKCNFRQKTFLQVDGDDFAFSRKVGDEVHIIFNGKDLGPSTTWGSTYVKIFDGNILYAKSTKTDSSKKYNLVLNDKEVASCEKEDCEFFDFVRSETVDNSDANSISDIPLFWYCSFAYQDRKCFFPGKDPVSLPGGFIYDIFVVDKKFGIISSSGFFVDDKKVSDDNEKILDIAYFDSENILYVFADNDLEHMDIGSAISFNGKKHRDVIKYKYIDGNFGYLQSGETLTEMQKRKMGDKKPLNKFFLNGKEMGKAIDFDIDGEHYTFIDAVSGNIIIDGQEAIKVPELTSAKEIDISGKN